MLIVLSKDLKNANIEKRAVAQKTSYRSERSLTANFK